MSSVCVDRDKSRLEQLKLLIFLTVSVNFQTVSVLQSVEIQYQISCDLQSLRLKSEKNPKSGSSSFVIKKP